MRRSRLARRTPLRATKGLKAGKGLAPVSDRMRAAAADRAAVRVDVIQRDNLRCRIAPLVPDVACFGPLTVHHLRKASQGGTFTMDNLITACAWHNSWVETEPARARSLGLVL